MQTRQVSVRLMMGLLTAGAVCSGPVSAQAVQTAKTAAVKKDADAAAVRAKAAEVHAPSRVPDRIVLTFAGDPATSVAVSWRTSVDVRRARGEIVPVPAGPGFEPDAVGVKANSQALLSDLGSAHYHTVRFRDLIPNTKYAYRVGDGTNWSEWFHYTTASDRPEPFSFIYFGDAQTSLKSQWSRVVREAWRDAPQARFMIHAGDLIDRAESDAQWGEWHGAGGWLNGMVPSIAVPGNHEQVADQGGTRLSRHWRPQFEFPRNGPFGLDETCYTLVYQGVRIIALDTNRQIAEQAAWMDKVLSANTSPWVVCTFHHPIFSTNIARDNVKQRMLWKPIFDKYRVDLVLQGHDHTYARTNFETPLANWRKVENLLVGTNEIDRDAGTVYVISVSGPKMYAMQKQSFLKRQIANTQLYQIVRVDGSRLRYEARKATGELHDAFTLVKQPGRVNTIIEQHFAEPAAEDTAAGGE